MRSTSIVLNFQTISKNFKTLNTIDAKKIY